MTTRALWIAAFVLPAPFLWIHRGQLPLCDAALTYHAVRETARTGIPRLTDGSPATWHVPTQLYAAAAGIKLFGESPASARVAGVAWFFGTVVLIGAIVGRLSTAAWGGAAALAYAVQPLAIHGALLIDLDNTMLTFAVTALFGWWALRGPPRGRRDAAALAGLYALAILSKEFALGLTLPGMLLSLVAHRAPARQWGWTAAALLGGAALAAALFGGFCAATGYPFLAMFSHDTTHLSTFLSAPWGIGQALMQRARFVAAFTFWVLPPALTALAAVTLPSLRSLVSRRRAPEPQDVLFYQGWTYLAITLSINGAAWWFPRYECPAWPLLLTGGMIVAARWTGTRRGFARLAALATLCVVLGVLLVGDVGVLTQHDLKGAIVEGTRTTRAILTEAALKTILALAPLALVKPLAGGLRPALPALLIGPALALNAIQIQYENTTYGTGMRGAHEMMRRLSELPAGSVVVGPYEATTLSPARHLHTSESDFHRPERFVARIEDPECAVVVMSLARNTAASLQRALGPSEIADLLNRSYRLERVGDYWVWRRR